MSNLDRVRRLEPVEFRYEPSIDPDQKLRAGFLAQQVKSVIPEAVVEINGIEMINLKTLRGVVDAAVREYMERRS